MESENLYTLHYFELHVRADPMRNLLTHAGVKFNDHHISFKEWPELKASMPNQQLPCLELPDGTKMGQSFAILRFLGKKHGYYPEDALQAFKCDEHIDRYNDVLSAVYKPHFEKDKDAMIENIVKKVLPIYLKQIDEICAKGEFICGPKITIADFAIGGLYSNYLANENISFAKDQF